MIVWIVCFYGFYKYERKLSRSLVSYIFTFDFLELQSRQSNCRNFINNMCTDWKPKCEFFCNQPIFNDALPVYISLFSGNIFSELWDKLLKVLLICLAVPAPVPFLELSNGYKVPAIGLGTFQVLEINIQTGIYPKMFSLLKNQSWQF